MFLCFLKAWIVGLAIAAPVGPIGMLCIKKTLELGFIGAILVGLGAAVADSCYGLVAAFGLSVLSNFLLEKALFIKIIGGIFLLYLAYKEGRSANVGSAVVLKSKGKIKIIIEVFFLTITNPMTILSFLSIFASIRGDFVSIQDSLVMVFGIFLGSMSWWLLLGRIIVKIQHKLPEIWLERMKYISCLILGGFGIFSIITAIF